MTRYRCNSCNGEYDDLNVQSDGSIYQYFHACSPIRNPAYDPILRPQVPQFLPRPNARNENVVELIGSGEKLEMEVDSENPNQWRAKTRIVSAGSGRTAI